MKSLDEFLGGLGPMTWDNKMKAWGDYAAANNPFKNVRVDAAGNPGLSQAAMNQRAAAAGAGLLGANPTNPLAKAYDTLGTGPVSPNAAASPAASTAATSRILGGIPYSNPAAAPQVASGPTASANAVLGTGGTGGANALQNQYNTFATGMANYGYVPTYNEWLQWSGNSGGTNAPNSAGGPDTKGPSVTSDPLSMAGGPGGYGPGYGAGFTPGGLTNLGGIGNIPTGSYVPGGGGFAANPGSAVNTPNGNPPTGGLGSGGGWSPPAFNFASGTNTPTLGGGTAGGGANASVTAPPGPAAGNWWPTSPGANGPSYGGIGRDIGGEFGSIVQYLGPYANYAYDISRTFNPLYTQLNQSNYSNLLSSLPGQMNAAWSAANPQLAAAQGNLGSYLSAINSNMPTGVNAAGYTASTASPVLSPSAERARMEGDPLNVSAMQVNPYTGFNAVQAASGNPGLAWAQGQLGGFSPSAIQQTLQQQALQGLQLGTQLSPEETRQAQQAAREAWSARGLAGSPGAMADEVLNQYQLGQQRLRERQGFGAAVDQNAFSQGQQAFGSALGLSNAALGYGNLGLEAQRANLGAQLTGNQLGFQGQLANQDAGLRAALANQATNYNFANLGTQNNQFNAAQANNLAGMMAQLYQQNNQYNAGLANQANQFNANATNAMNQFNQNLRMQGNQNAWNNAMGYGQFLQGSTINPFATASSLMGNAPDYTPNMLGYGGDLFGTNYNAATAARINAGNNSAANNANLMRLAGTLGGAAIGSGALGTASTGLLGTAGSWLGALSLLCWVAREVYGVENPKWLQFREWMLTRAPENLRSLYIAHGEQFADFIKDKPALKDAVRGWMDMKVNEMMQNA